MSATPDSRKSVLESLIGFIMDPLPERMVLPERPAAGVLPPEIWAAYEERERERRETSWWYSMLIWHPVDDVRRGFHAGYVWEDVSLDALFASELDGARAIMRRFRGRVTWTAPVWRVWNGRVHSIDSGGVVDMIGNTYADEFDRAVREIEGAFEIKIELERDAKPSYGVTADKAQKEFLAARKAYRSRMLKQLTFRDRLRSDTGQTGLLKRLRSEATLADADFDADVRWLVVGNGAGPGRGARR